MLIFGKGSQPGTYTRRSRRDNGRWLVSFFKIGLREEPELTSYRYYVSCSTKMVYSTIACPNKTCNFYPLSKWRSTSILNPFAISNASNSSPPARPRSPRIFVSLGIRESFHQYATIRQFIIIIMSQVQY